MPKQCYGKKNQGCFFFFPKGDIFSVPLSHTCVISFLVLVVFSHNNPTMHFMGQSLKLCWCSNFIGIVTALWQQFPTGNDVHSPLLPERFWQCLETFYVITTGEVLLASGGLKPTTQHPLMQSSASYTKNYSSPNVNSAKVEKLYCRATVDWKAGN